MTGKYKAWDPFFARLSNGEHQFTFDQLEQQTGVSLPASARAHPSWWGNTQYHARWARHGWFASARVRDEVVTFRRSPASRGRQPRDTPRRVAHAGTARHPIAPDERLVLLGCVGQKRDIPQPAKDLYRSPLWKMRRGYAEATGQPWAILSAEHGLLAPDTVIPPYDRSLARESARYRRDWSTRTAKATLALLDRLGLWDVEVHAGAAYIEGELGNALEQSGVRVHRPLRGLRIGEQLGWYVSQGPAAQPLGQTPVYPLTRASGSHAKAVAATYRSGALGESWSDLPEAWRMPQAGPVAARTWLTFVCAVNRARDAARLWSAAQRAWEADPWIFEPEQVARRPLHALVGALQQHGVSQRHSVDSQAWRMVGEALASDRCPEPIRRAIDGREVDARSVLDALASTWSGGAAMFPLLRGAKIAPMWVRMLAFPGQAAITGLEEIPVAVDTHVQRVTEMLGLVPPKRLDERHRAAIQDAWFEAARQAGPFGAPAPLDGTAAGLDPALWAIGRRGCSACEAAGTKIPIGPICELCLLGRIAT